MNFDKLANAINENYSFTSEEAEARKNPEFQAWKDTQGADFLSTLRNPYTYWYTKVRNKPEIAPNPMSTGDEPPMPKTSRLGAGASKRLARTQELVDQVVAANPNATIDDIMAEITPRLQVSGPIGFDYETDPRAIKNMLAVAKGEEPVMQSEPSLGDIDAEKAAKRERLRRFVSMNRAERDKFLSSFRDKPEELSSGEPEESEDEEEIDPYVSGYVSGMKKRKDTEDEDEGAEDYESD